MYEAVLTHKLVISCSRDWIIEVSAFTRWLLAQKSVGGVRRAERELRARERGEPQRSRVGVRGEHQAVRAQRAQEHRVRALRVRRAHRLEHLPQVVAASARRTSHVLLSWEVGRLGSWEVGKLGS